MRLGAKSVAAEARDKLQRKFAANSLESLTKFELEILYRRQGPENGLFGDVTCNLHPNAILRPQIANLSFDRLGAAIFDFNYVVEELWIAGMCPRESSDSEAGFARKIAVAQDIGILTAGDDPRRQ
jgi:hypothetical protein